MVSLKKEKRYTISAYQIIVLLVVCILIFIATLNFLQSNKKIMPPQIGTQTPTSIIQNYIDTGEGSYAVATNIPHQMKFVSPKLGISFLYLSALGDKEPYQFFTVKEVGDKVHLYDSQLEKYTEGYFVEVFPKSPQDDLATAIQKTILQGYSSKDCFIRDTVPYVPYTPSVPSDKIAIIDIPRNGDVYQAIAKCPSPYTRLSGTEYFLMDKNHPNTFAYFQIGTDDLPADNNSNGKTWDATLQFLK